MVEILNGSQEEKDVAQGQGVAFCSVCNADIAFGGQAVEFVK